LSHTLNQLSPSSSRLRFRDAASPRLDSEVLLGKTETGTLKAVEDDDVPGVSLIRGIGIDDFGVAMFVFTANVGVVVDLVMRVRD